MEIDVCKGCKGYLKSIYLHGGEKFIESPYIPYKVNFLYVKPSGYGYDFGGFFKISSKYPPRILNNNPQIHNREVFAQ